MRLLTAGVTALACASRLSSCLPAPQAFGPAGLIDPADLGARNAATEWWCVPGYLPGSGLPFHWAQFKVSCRGLPYHAGHVAVTDLSTGRLTVLENDAPDARFRSWDVTAPALRLTLSAVHDEQALLSKTTSVACWEEPVRGAGTLAVQPVTAQGMGEFVGGVLTRAGGEGAATLLKTLQT